MKNQSVQIKPTLQGVKAALASLDYILNIPSALKCVNPADRFNDEELSFAEYLIWDTDFGGAWNDESQIKMHCVDANDFQTASVA